MAWYHETYEISNDFIILKALIVFELRIPINNWLFAKRYSYVHCGRVGLLSIAQNKWKIT